MAQRINVQLVDDLDGSDAIETVSFALDGQQYEIDLSEGNATRLRDTLSTFVAHGRRVTGGGRRRSGGTSRTSTSARAGSGPSAADIRAWARENGLEVPDRGRVSAEVREAYDAAH